MDGTWTLEVATPFGTHPATLTFERKGNNGALSGRIKSQLGDALLTDITDEGHSFDATVALTLQGRTYEATITGQTEDNQIDGSINVKYPFAPKIKFTGTRAV